MNKKSNTDILNIKIDIIFHKNIYILRPLGSWGWPNDGFRLSANKVLISKYNHSSGIMSGSK